MDGEVVDITSFVQSFDLTLNAGFKPNTPVDGEDGTFAWNFLAVEQQIEMTATPAFVAAAFGAEKGALVKMQHRGRFWFDVKYDADVYLKDVGFSPDGAISATYNGLNIVDRTDQSLLARFLRWLLRRA